MPGIPVPDVRERGWIEVGRQEGGFVDRALADAGLVFENSSCHTLAEALDALEAGLAGRFRDSAPCSVH
jgi:hypothetical protein